MGKRWTITHDDDCLPDHVSINEFGGDIAHTQFAQVVWRMSGEERSPQCEARVHLIVAAPELLEALQGLLDHYVALVNCGDCGNWDPNEEAPVIAARAAIAKAEGRS